MPDRAYLHPIDPDLLPGAHNAIDVCLQLKPQERITIITDTVTRGIAAALQSEVERVGSKYSLFVLAHHARRPLSYMPEIILDDLALSQVSIFAAQSQPNELGARTEMSGVFVVDGVVGDYLCERFGDLQSNPLTIEVEDNRIRALRSENKDLRDEFRAYTNTDENSNRVGEFAIGTNTACTHIIGHILQDEKIPGVHIAFGHPYAEHTGANWVSKTHIDCVGRDFDIWFDGQQVMQGGKFLI